MEKNGRQMLSGMRGAAAGCGCVLAWLLAGLAGERLCPAAGSGGAVWGLRLAAGLLQAVPPLLLARGLGLSGGELGCCRPGRGGGAPTALALAVMLAGALLLPGATQALPRGGAARVLAFLALCPAAAWAEELVFRGAVQGCFAASGLGGPWLAVLAQALLFAGLHSGPAGMLYALGMGLALGWLRQRTGSIRPGAVLHLLNNAVVFGSLL